MNWPDNRDFAFTIIDDTDNSTVENVEPVYKYLYEKNIITTKTVWVYNSRDRFTGQCLIDDQYLTFITDLKKKGYEIALHGVGSGNFNRNDISNGIEIFKEKTGKYPCLHVNHAQNPDNIYWGFNGYDSLLKIYSKIRGKKELFFGENEESEHFWGDIFKKHIKYLRFRTFDEVNTLNADPRMPYRNRKKKYANYIFSASNGKDVNTFNKLLLSDNIEKLKAERGLCIAYTHFASGFYVNGVLNEEFQKTIERLTRQNCWIAPVSEILDYILNVRKDKKEYVTNGYLFYQEFKILLNNLLRKRYDY